MATCEWCGKEFDQEEARRSLASKYDIDSIYDEYIEEYACGAVVCDECLVPEIENDIAMGAEAMGLDED